MSIEALGWAIRQEVFPSTRKFVLVMLGNFCGDTGLAYPSVKTLANATGLQEETVAKALEALVESGVISDTGRRSGETRRIRVFKLPESAWCNTPENRGIKSPANPLLILGKSSIPAESHIEELEQEQYVVRKAPPNTTIEKFTKPTLQECLDYGPKIKLTDDASEGFFDYFTSNGWRVSGKAPMKDWQSAMRNWKRNENSFQRAPSRRDSIEILEHRIANHPANYEFIRHDPNCTEAQKQELDELKRKRLSALNGHLR